MTGWPWLMAAFWGMLFHMVTDMIYLYAQGRLFRRALSIVEYAVRIRLMKRHGLQPEEIYSSVLAQMAGTGGPLEEQPREADSENR